MRKKATLKYTGLIMLGCGVLLLVPTVLGSLLVGVRFLGAADAGAPELGREYTGSNRFVKKEILLRAPNALTYKLSILSKTFIPARLYLRGGVSIQKDAKTRADFNARFDGVTMMVSANGRELYRTDLEPGNLHYRTFRIELPEFPGGQITVAFDPGPAGNADYDWANIRNLRIEPSFTGSFVLASALLIVGLVLVRSGRGRAGTFPDGGAPEVKTGRISTGRRFLYSALVTLVLTAVVLEAAFIKLSRSSILPQWFPWIVPPGLTRVEANKEYRYDSEAGFSLRPDIKIEYEFKDGDLDPAALKRGRPIAVSHGTDGYGFRNARAPGSARIAVMGDSFAQGIHVNRPFAEGVSDLLGVSVYNLGTSGYGTLQEEVSLRRMLPELASLEVVVLTWFGGNDIGDNQHFIEARDSGELLHEYDAIVHNTVMAAAPAGYFPLERRLFGRVLLRLVPRTMDLAGRFELIKMTPPSPGRLEPGVPSGSTPSKKEEESKVFVLKLGGKETTFAFTLLPLYDEENSAGMEEGLASISRVRDLLSAGGAQVLVCYIPVKFVVYREALGESCPDAELGRRVMSIAEGWHADTPEQLIEKVDHDITLQKERIAEYCASGGIPFLDLTPGFRKKAFDKLLYYENDSHFNQAGHDLAADLIAREIKRRWPGRFKSSKMIEK